MEKRHQINNGTIVVFDHDVTIEELRRVVPDNFNGDVVINGKLTAGTSIIDFPVTTLCMLIPTDRDECVVLDYPIHICKD